MFTVEGSSTYEIQEKEGTVWTPVPYIVAARQIENKSLLTLTLDPLGDQSIEPILPGQFNMLYVFGVGEIPISVSSLAKPYPTLTHTVQGVGPVSKAINNLAVGDMIGVRGPFGTVWPVEEARSRDVLIMAGGVGLCPLKPVVETILNDRDQYGRVNILFGTRDPDSIIFHQDIISWQSDPSINFLITVDHAFSKWSGNVGVVTHLIQKANFDPENTIAFICGPEMMMRFGAYACLDTHILEDNIFLSMERNMKCALGFCGHCQLGPYFICKEGSVFRYTSLKPYLNVAEL